MTVYSQPEMGRLHFESNWLQITLEKTTELITNYNYRLFQKYPQITNYRLHSLGLSKITDYNYCNRITSTDYRLQIWRVTFLKPKYLQFFAMKGHHRDCSSMFPYIMSILLSFKHHYCFNLWLLYVLTQGRSNTECCPN